MPLSLGNDAPLNNLEERFMSHVEVTDDCWLWTGRMAPQGYGNFRVDGKSIGVHRLAYEMFVGEIPANRVVDHVCHNNSGCVGGWACLHRRCVNPEHLAAVTQQQNLAESNLTTVGQQTCRKGLHAYTEDNIVTEKDGSKRCKSCRTIKDKARWQKILAERNQYAT